MRANHNYTLRVAHLMRLNPLEEVQSVGIIVERNSSVGACNDIAKFIGRPHFIKS